MTLRSLSHRAPLLGLLGAWGVGSALAHAGRINWPAAAWASLAVAGLVALWLAGKSRAAWWGGLTLALLAAGALRTEQARQRLGEWDRLELPPREARLTLEITRTFAPKRPELATGLARVTGASAHLADLVGQKVYFSCAWPMDAEPPLRSVSFEARGVLRTVAAHPPQTTFDRYLADSGANFSLERARLSGPPGPAAAWPRLCAKLGAKLEDVLRVGTSEHRGFADLYVAMMLGQKEELSEQQHDWFVRSGTMHLFAISGLHIAGIGLAVHTLLALLRIPSRVVFVVGSLILWVYVEITGAAPSAVRAYWMVTCLLGARELRLPGNGVAALCLSALVVLVREPQQLFAPGFQMSYGIVAALLLYGVPLQEKWNVAWQPWRAIPEAERGRVRRWAEAFVRLLMDLVALGLAATLISLPAGVGFFQLVAPGGFFLNLLLIPLAGLVLFAGVASMIVGLAGLGALASLFNHAALLVLALMETAIEQTLRVPLVSWPAEFRAEWMFSAAMSLMILLLVCGYARSWKTREGGHWLPYAVLIAGMVFCLRAPAG